MAELNMERGDTFITTDTRFVGHHFTCVGVRNNGFFAGDIGGRMWMFKRVTPEKYEIRKARGKTWGPKREIDAETIIGE